MELYLLPHFLASARCLVFCLLVLTSRLSHQGVFFKTTFDDPRFDSAGAVANFVAGNLIKSVLAKCLTDAVVWWHEPLGQKGIAGDRETHLTRELLVNKRRLSTDEPDHVISQQCRP